MAETGYWVHNLDPKLFHIWGDIGVSYYGLAYVLGFVFSVAMHRLMLRKGRSPIKREDEELVLYAMVLGVIIGARLGYCILYALPELFSRPWFIIEVWHGGMSFHGGFIGVLVAAWYVSRRTGARITQLGDMLAPMAPFGLLLGRIANFINGELWGRVTHVPWAVIFPRSAPVMDISLIPPRHPSQLYEAALEGGLLLLWMQLRFWKTDAYRHPGRMTGEFMVLYAIFRIICEFFREPDAPLMFGISRGIFYSLFILLGGSGFWIYSIKKTVEPSTILPQQVTPPKRKSSKKKR